jgi:hypothetical protein
LAPVVPAIANWNPPRGSDRSRSGGEPLEDTLALRTARRFSYGARERPRPIRAGANLAL